MHHFIFPSSDSWITSGSNLITGVTEEDQNFGQDEILELKKFYHNTSLHHHSRILINFDGPDLKVLSQSVSLGKITNPKYYFTAVRFGVQALDALAIETLAPVLWVQTNSTRCHLLGGGRNKSYHPHSFCTAGHWRLNWLRLCRRYAV